MVSLWVQQATVCNASISIIKYIWAKEDRWLLFIDIYIAICISTGVFYAYIGLNAFNDISKRMEE